MAPQEIQHLSVDALMPDPTQPRKTFPDDEIASLAASVIARGVLQPLRVRWDETHHVHWLVSGESRWRAARLAGLATVPCLVVVGALTETEILSDQIIENHLRHSLRPLELARALTRLKALKKCTSQQLAAELGISGSAISKGETLLSLPEGIQTMIDDGRVSESAGYEIARLPGDDAAKFELAGAVAAKGMNRDQVADAVRQKIGKRHVTPKAGRIVCKLDQGVSITLTAGQPWTWDELLAAIDRVRREAKKLCDGGKEIAALARTLRAS
jgi:ParB family transcriptional regulator, chromosome partitioning protein